VSGLLTIGLFQACASTGEPVSPAGSSQYSNQTQVSHFLFENSLDAPVITTTAQKTGGPPPGVVCYLNRPGPDGRLVRLENDPAQGTECRVVQSDSTFQGRAVVPASFVNQGYAIRILLFWVPNQGWGNWDY
jgi:hypothetical protein